MNRIPNILKRLPDCKYYDTFNNKKIITSDHYRIHVKNSTLTSLKVVNKMFNKKECLVIFKMHHDNKTISTFFTNYQKSNTLFIDPNIAINRSPLNGNPDIFTIVGERLTGFNVNGNNIGLSFGNSTIFNKVKKVEWLITVLK